MHREVPDFSLVRVVPPGPVEPATVQDMPHTMALIYVLIGWH